MWLLNIIKQIKGNHCSFKRKKKKKSFPLKLELFKSTWLQNSNMDLDAAGTAQNNFWEPSLMAMPQPLRVLGLVAREKAAQAMAEQRGTKPHTSVRDHITAKDTQQPSQQANVRPEAESVSSSEWRSAVSRSLAEGPADHKPPAWCSNRTSSGRTHRSL